MCHLHCITPATLNNKQNGFFCKGLRGMVSFITLPCKLSLGFRLTLSNWKWQHRWQIICYILDCLNERYCINSSEIPGELSRINMISKHVKVTCNFTRENKTLFLKGIRSRLPWLHNPLKSTLMCSCMSETSSVLHRFVLGYLWKPSAIFGNFRKMFGNDCLAFGQLLENLR